MTHELTPNQPYEGERVTCLFRCTIKRNVVVKKGKKTSSHTLTNQCRLIRGGSKTCIHPLDNENTCNIPKYKTTNSKVKKNEDQDNH